MIVVVGLVLMVLAVLALGAFYPGSGAEQLDWKPTRSPHVEAQNEVDDVRQMIEAQNALRRKRGAAEITQDDVERQAREDQAFRARGRGPFGEGASTEDDDPH